LLDRDSDTIGSADTIGRWHTHYMHYSRSVDTIAMEEASEGSRKAASS
jgi:hypothetical protein